MNDSRRKLAPLVAVCLATIAAPGGALAAGDAETFSGTCAGQEGYASWPDEPLRAVPVDTVLLARVSGGSCSGTLDGAPIESIPASVSVALSGVQACAGGVTSGHGVIRVAGRRIGAHVSYRRVGRLVTMIWRGDAGGVAVLIAHARVGLLSEEHPLAATPAGPLVSDRVTVGEVLQTCAADGFRRMPVQIDRFETVSLLSG